MVRGARVWMGSGSDPQRDWGQKRLGSGFQVSKLWQVTNFKHNNLRLGILTLSYFCSVVLVKGHQGLAALALDQPLPVTFTFTYRAFPESDEMCR